MTTVNVYAPISKATQNEKINVDFMLILCSVVSTVPSEDVLLLLDDFNARVGSRIRSVNYDKEQHVDGMAGDKFTWGSALLEVGPL